MDTLLSSNLEEAASGLLNLESTWSIGKKSEKISGKYFIMSCLCSRSIILPVFLRYRTGRTNSDRRAVTIFDTPQHLFCSSMHKYVCARTPEIFMVLFHVESRLKQTKYRVNSNS